LEEKINNMINAKKELAEIAISKGDIFISEFNDDEIRKIVSLEKEDKVLR
jgi:SNF2 family DNA or RNA helicase